MSKIILKAHNISKQYRIGTIGTGSLSHDINRWWHKIRGKEDPYLEVGAENDKSSKVDTDYVWALKDVSFEVNEGDVLGIIGKNGAGKSTLLKILSRITSPTTGYIKSYGRIASLLEVGTGFHPELTGRENIYLNGTILGMRKAEIKAKEDEIIDFSGCALYIDTPVKRYSSGMRVRLAFAVAAHLDPDILIVDEVLAVGDAEFQKKAIGKMKDISGKQGRTVLFVSHNMGSIKSLCNRALVLNNGFVVFEGEANEAIDYYLNIDSRKVSSGEINFEIDETKELSLINVKVLDNKKRIRTAFMQSEEITIYISFYANQKVLGSRFNLHVKTVNEEMAFITSSHNLTKNGIEKGKHTLKLKIPPNLLNNKRYILSLNADIPGRKFIIDFLDVIFFDIERENIGGSDFCENWAGLVCPKINWTLNDFKS